MEFHLFLPQLRLSFGRLVASARAAEAAETATRRFGATQPVVGTGPELADHFSRLGGRGVERVCAWFCDFAPPDTLAAFGAEVIAPLAARHAPGTAAGREGARR